MKRDPLKDQAGRDADSSFQPESAEGWFGHEPAPEKHRGSQAADAVAAPPRSERAAARRAGRAAAASQPPAVLGLRSGDVVAVRSEEEILATLDDSGALDALPFMPEMLRYCGERFRVRKRADKTCDTIERTGIRRMENTVHLGDMRCDGSAHGGCEASCLLFWKESWLKRVSPDIVSEQEIASRSTARARAATPTPQLAELCLRAAVRNPDRGAEEPVAYSCQATELRKATGDVSTWNVSQYWTDWVTGNVALRELARGFCIWFYNTVQRVRRGGQFPFLEGKLKQTPDEKLDLRPGELVEVKSIGEILATLDTRLRNRGLMFDREMVRYCGGRYRVLRRVEKLLDEKTGVMMKLPNNCIILDGVVCVGDLHRFCPRAIYPYWREIWLRRVP